MLDRGLYQLQKTLGLGERYYKESENDERIVIQIAAPGATDETEFKITMSKEKLKVVFGGNIFTSSFLYLYPIPKVDRLKSSAELKDGILTIILPKKLGN